MKHLVQLVEGEGLLAVDGGERLAVHRPRKLLAAHWRGRRGGVGAVVVGVRGEGPSAVRLLQGGGRVWVGQQVHGGNAPGARAAAAVGRVRGLRKGVA